MITILLIALPFLASLLVMMLGSSAAKRIALMASFVQLAITIFVLSKFQHNADVQFETNFMWISSLGTNFHVGMDGISILLVLLTNLLVPFIIYSSFNKEIKNANSFYALILFMQSALVGVFVSLDGFLFYTFWELALIPIWFICLIWGGEGREKITFKFFVYTLTGSLFMLVALIYVYLQTPGEHSFDINALYQAGRALPVAEQGWIFLGMFIAFAIKMPVFPFHTWQPDTYTNAPTQGTMLLSGIMLKMGAYGLIRWLLPLVPMGVDKYGALAITLSVIGIVYASCLAIVQKDFKRLIAYSSIAHVGLISAGIFSGNIQGLQGAIIQMFAHGINVVALFFIADIIFSRTNTRQIHDLGGIRNVAPKFAAMFLIVLLGSVALPLTNGFVGEFLLLNGVYQYGAWTAAFAGLTVILGAVYMLRSYQSVMLGEVKAITSSFAEIKSNEKMILIPIVLIIIATGIYPKPLMEIAEPAAQKIIELVNVVK